jgi:hypothetical protein
MTQPSGLDKLFSQSSLLFPSRSSPFVCLADALEVLALLLIHLSRGKTLRHAALEVNWQRARSRLGQDVTELEDSPAEKHPIPFGILFIATLLQAIKLSGMQGLPWTTAWAGFYLFSYVMLAMVGFLARKDWRDSPPEMIIETPTGRPTWWKLENLSKALLYGSLGVHFICCCWVLDRVIGFVPDGEPASRGMTAAAFGPYVVYMILIFLTMAAVVFAPWMLYQGFLWLTSTEIISGTFRPLTARFVLLRECLNLAEAIMLISSFISFAISFTVSYFFYILYVPLFPQGEKVSEVTLFGNFAAVIRGSGNILMYILILGAIVGIFWLLERLVPGLKKLNSVLKKQGPLLIFAFSNFLLSLLYYCIRYNSQGTFKPSWTNRLG